MMERWEKLRRKMKKGKKRLLPNIPIFHHSNIPVFDWL